MKRLAAWIVVLALAGYLLFWPVPIQPVAWQPLPDPGFSGAYAPNDRLAGVRRIAGGAGRGPEDVAIGADGAIHAGFEDGRIVRFDADGGNPDLIAHTAGRPLGLAFDAAGRLLVADAHRGLLRVEQSGAIEVLAVTADGQRFGFTDDLDVAPDGRIWFSDASSRFGIGEDLRLDLLERGGNGRLLVHDPASRETRVVLSGLHFANGVAVDPQGRFVLVVQTGDYSVSRHWLAGPRAGTTEPFIVNLPGFPDGITRDGRGGYWLAIYAPRVALLDALAPYPFLRKVIPRLPHWLGPQPQRLSMALRLDADGQVVDNLQFRGEGAFAPVTNVVESGGRLYLGSLAESAIGVLPLGAGTER